MNYLGHDFIHEGTMVSSYINYYFCLHCGLIINYTSEKQILISYKNKFLDNEFRSNNIILNLTCNEIIIKKLLE